MRWVGAHLREMHVSCSCRSHGRISLLSLIFRSDVRDLRRVQMSLNVTRLSSLICLSVMPRTTRSHKDKMSIHICHMRLEARGTVVRGALCRGRHLEGITARYGYRKAYVLTVLSVWAVPVRYVLNGQMMNGFLSDSSACKQSSSTMDTKLIAVAPEVTELV